MSQVDAPSPPDDAPVPIDLEEAISADPDSPEGIGEMLICLVTCAEHYGYHRSMASCPGISLDQRLDEMRDMNKCCLSAKRWLGEVLPRLRRLKSDVIKDRIPEAGPFLVDAGVLAEELFSTMQFDFARLPELYKIALESYNRPGSPGWDPLDNSLRQFSNTAHIFKNQLDTLAATLRDRYANKLRQVATSRIETENVDEESHDDQQHPLTIVPDPVENCELAALGPVGAEYLSKAIRKALHAAGAAVPTVGSGGQRSWTHCQPRTAYDKLPKGKLRKLLEKYGFTNRHQTA